MILYREKHCKPIIWTEKFTDKRYRSLTRIFGYVKRCAGYMNLYYLSLNKILLHQRSHFNDLTIQLRKKASFIQKTFMVSPKKIRIHISPKKNDADFVCLQKIHYQGFQTDS